MARLFLKSSRDFLKDKLQIRCSRDPQLLRSCDPRQLRSEQETTDRAKEFHLSCALASGGADLSYGLIIPSSGPMVEGAQTVFIHLLTMRIEKGWYYICIHTKVQMTVGLGQLRTPALATIPAFTSARIDLTYLLITY